MPAYLCPGKRFCCSRVFWPIPSTLCGSPGSSWWRRWRRRSAITLASRLGYYGGRPLLERYQAFFRIRHATVERGENLFARYGAVTIFFARFVFGMRIIAGPMAGVLRMPWRKFTVFNFLGASLWVTVISGAGYLFGRHWGRLERDVKRFDMTVAIVVLLGAAWLWWRSRRVN